MVGVFKTVSRGVTVDRSGRPGAQRHRTPAAGSLALQPLLFPPPPSGCCDGSCEGTLHIQLPDAPVPDPGLASRSHRYSHRRGPPPACFSYHRRSGLDRNRGWRSFCKSVCTRSGCQRLRPNLQQVTHSNIKLAHDALLDCLAPQ